MYYGTRFQVRSRPLVGLKDTCSRERKVGGRESYLSFIHNFTGLRRPTYLLVPLSLPLVKFLGGCFLFFRKTRKADVDPVCVCVCMYTSVCTRV